MGNGKYTIGIDIGATKANIGIIDENYTICGKTKVPTNTGQESGKILSDIAQAVKNCMADLKLEIQDISFMGIGVPGTVDDKGKKVIFAPNLKWRNVEIAEILKSEFSCEICVEHDVKAAAAGELLAGAGRGMSDIVCMTLGSGIACGIIIDKKIHRGAFNTAGEIGHMVINPNGPACNCGKKGCVEAYGSGTGIGRRATEMFGRKMSSEEVFELEKQGDQRAADIITAGVEAIGISLVGVVNLLSPEAVILSGGLTNQKEYAARIKEFVLSNSYNLAVPKDKFKFAIAELGPDAPMVGAAILSNLN